MPLIPKELLSCPSVLSGLHFHLHPFPLAGLKRLAPGLVELSSPSFNQRSMGPASALDLHQEALTLLTPSQLTTLWLVASINGSNSNMLGFERFLSSILGPKANKKGSFRLLTEQSLRLSGCNLRCWLKLMATKLC
ncbi:hypothetical protein Ancab_017563 [Ancistrocladus abbreviatus]